MRYAIFTLLIALVSCGAYAEDRSASVRVAILVADAEKLYREGKLREAVELYDKAAARAFSEGATGRAFEVSRTAAAVLQEVGDSSEAGARLRRLATGAPDHPDAAAAHHAAIVCLAQSSLQSKEAGEEYADAMVEYLEQWPHGKSAEETNRWLANWRLANGQWQEAMQLCEEVVSGAPRYAEYLAVYGLAASQQIAHLSSKEEAKQLAQQATSKLLPLVTGEHNRWPKQWTETQRNAALALARVHMAFGESGPQYPYRLLNAAASGDPKPSGAWSDQALPLLVTACVEAGEFEKAATWSQRLPESSAESVKPLVGSLVERVLEGGDRRAIGELLLGLTERFSDEASSDAPQMGRVAGWIATGKIEVALRELALREKGPADRTVRRLSALALSQRADEESRQEAMAIYRDLEIENRPGGPGWYRARLSRMELLIAMGQRSDAQKLLKLTQALYAAPTEVSLRERLELLVTKLE